MEQHTQHKTQQYGTLDLMIPLSKTSEKIKTETKRSLSENGFKNIRSAQTLQHLQQSTRGHVWRK